MTDLQSRPVEAHCKEPRGSRPLLVGTSTILVGGLSIVLGIAAMSGGIGSVSISWLLPFSGLQFSADSTSGLFLLMNGAVGIAVGTYSIGYYRHSHASTFSLMMLPIFLLTVIAVLLAGSVTTLLLMWELMAVSSMVLLLTEYRKKEVRDAAQWYGALTQLGFLAILAGTLIMSGGSAGVFSTLAITSHHLSESLRGLVFVLTFIGFGSKAGLVPLHVWLPRAHSEAPGPVSAVMSAVMAAMGIYGIMRVDIQLLGHGPRWWGVVALSVGAVSALYGALQASVATDLKRLLGYSTTENMGIVVLAIGMSMLLGGYGQYELAAVALVAGTYQLLAHAAFKTLTFLAAGAVHSATGLRNLDLMGGLAKRLPVTSSMFAVGALGASGLPLGAGFVGEWLLLQSLIHSHFGSSAPLEFAIPVAVGVLALTTGLGTAAVVKAYGVGFLARPRSKGAESATEVGLPMLAGMAVAAVGCLAVAIAPALFNGVLTSLMTVLYRGVSVSPPRLGAILSIPGFAGSTSPILLAGFTVILVILAQVAISSFGKSNRLPKRDANLWACGNGILGERMQYTATSFAEPLQRVFDNVLKPEVGIEVTHYDESHYLVERVRYSRTIVDSIEDRLYRPVLRGFLWGANLIRVFHSGRISRYLALGAAGLFVVLVVSH